MMPAIRRRPPPRQRISSVRATRSWPVRRRPASGLQVAPLAAENQVLFISGPAATDGLTGINKYTFRSGRQSYQDVKTAASFLPDLQGKKVTVFAQDNAFGQANVAAVTRCSVPAAPP